MLKLIILAAASAAASFLLQVYISAPDEPFTLDKSEFIGWALVIFAGLYVLASALEYEKDPHGD